MNFQMIMMFQHGPMNVRNPLILIVCLLHWGSHLGNTMIVPNNNDMKFILSAKKIELLVSFFCYRYSPEQLFNVVAAVDLYHGFVPWCQRSEVLKEYPDGSFDAELEIGFKFLVESYTSHVEFERPKWIKVRTFFFFSFLFVGFEWVMDFTNMIWIHTFQTTARDTGLFDHLINLWQFKPGPVPGSCDLYFHVDFKFNSPLYRQVKTTSQNLCTYRVKLLLTKDIYKRIIVCLILRKIETWKLLINQRNLQENLIHFFLLRLKLGILLIRIEEFFKKMMVSLLLGRWILVNAKDCK